MKFCAEVKMCSICKNYIFLLIKNPPLCCLGAHVKGVSLGFQSDLDIYTCKRNLLLNIILWPPFHRQMIFLFFNRRGVSGHGLDLKSLSLAQNRFQDKAGFNFSVVTGKMYICLGNPSSYTTQAIFVLGDKRAKTVRLCTADTKLNKEEQLCDSIHSLSGLLPIWRL